MTQGYDFGQLYGQADTSGLKLLEKGWYEMVCTKAEWGTTRAGDKGQWTIEVIITTGQYAGSKLTTNITVSPVKQDGTVNEKGMGMMFRQLAAFGVPMPPDQQPFWVLGWREPQVAQFMVGKPVQGLVIQDEWDGGMNNKIRDFRPPRPGQPVQVQQAPHAQPAQPGYGVPQGVPQGGPASWNPVAAQAGQNGWQQPYPPQQPQQPAYGAPAMAAPAAGAQYQQAAPYPSEAPVPPAPAPQAGPVAPAAWQNAQQPPAGQQAAAPGAPWQAQPGVPGQGGMGEFTPQGQAQQPWMQQPQQPPAGPPAQQPPANYGQPAMPPFAQQQPQQPQPGQPPQQGAPEPPPWAQ